MAGGFPISGVESSLFNLHPPPALSPSLAFLGSMPGLLFWQAEPKEIFCKQRLQVTLSRLGPAHCRVSGQPLQQRDATTATPEQPAPQGSHRAGWGPVPSPAPLLSGDFIPTTHCPHTTSPSDGRTEQMTTDNSIRGVTE